MARRLSLGGSVRPVPGTMATSDRIGRALADIRPISKHGVVRTESHPGDQPLREACANPAAVHARIAAAATELGTTEHRVAASSVQYELAERLWTVAIALWSQHELVLDVTRLHVGTDAAVWRLAAPRPQAWHTDDQPDRVAASLAEPVLDLLAVLHRAIRVTTPIADGLLWGNAATAATLALGRVSGTTAHARADAVVATLLALAPLRNRLDTVNGTVVRRSCCLYYRSRAARICGDCSLSEQAAAKAIVKLRRPQ